MRKKLFLLFAVLYVVILICTACQKQTATNKIAPVNQETNQNINTNKQGCTKEGEYTYVTPDSPDCCEGLETITCDKPDDKGQCPKGCVGAGICAKCGDGNCGDGENMCNCPEDCKTLKCKEIGEPIYLGPDRDPNVQCCEGLNARMHINCYNPENCEVINTLCEPEYKGACIACGDGTCDAKTENKCNCPEDCKS